LGGKKRAPKKGKPKAFGKERGLKNPNIKGPLIKGRGSPKDTGNFLERSADFYYTI